MQVIQVQCSMFSNYINLEIDNKKISGKPPAFFKQNNILRNNPWIKEKIKTESRKYLALVKSKNRTYKICGVPLKKYLCVRWGEVFIVLNVFIKREVSQKNDLSFPLRNQKK